jgi:hypothetical protein
LSFYEGVGVGVGVGLLKIEESELEILKIKESESELLCTDSTALVKTVPFKVELKCLDIFIKFCNTIFNEFDLSAQKLFGLYGQTDG